MQHYDFWFGQPINFMVHIFFREAWTPYLYPKNPNLSKNQWVAFAKVCGMNLTYYGWRYNSFCKTVNLLANR